MSKFRIIITGAGLGGLATALFLNKEGHLVTILEGASKLSEIGAGIQIPLSSTRLLLSCRLTLQLLDKVVKPSAINLRRYASGDLELRY